MGIYGIIVCVICLVIMYINYFRIKKELALWESVKVVRTTARVRDYQTVSRNSGYRNFEYVFSAENSSAIVRKTTHDNKGKIPEMIEIMYEEGNPHHSIALMEVTRMKEVMRNTIILTPFVIVLYFFATILK
ncbi:MAG: hypothetical protein IKR11_07015 [Solobacterium sp.]|nr:hypothetical protein [Solobacterium sp.]